MTVWRRRCWVSTSRTVKVQEPLKVLWGFGDGFGLWDSLVDRGVCGKRTLEKVVMRKNAQ